MAPITGDTKAGHLVRALIIFSFLASTVPVLVQAFTAGRSAAIVAAEAPQSTIAKVAAQGLLVFLLVICVISLRYSGGRSSVRSHGALFVALLPWAVTLLLTFAGQEKLSLSSAAYPLLVLAFWCLNMRLSDLSPVGKIILWVALGSMCLGALMPSIGLVSGYDGGFVTVEKAFVDLPLLAGPYSHSNTLGGVLAMGGICALLLPPRFRNVVLAVVVAALVWSASRTGLYALGAAVLLAIVLRVVPMGARRVSATLAVLTAGVMVGMIPLMNTNSEAYSDRGQIWMGSLEASADHPWVGNGIAWYAEIARVNNSLAPQAFHGHNLFVHWLTTGGVFLVVAVVFFLLRALKVSNAQISEGNNFAACYLLGFLVMAMLEVNISFRDVTPTFWVMVLPLITIVLQPTKPNVSVMHAGLIRQTQIRSERTKMLPSSSHKVSPITPKFP